MTRHTLDRWAKNLAALLQSNGPRLPFDRAVRHHVKDLATLVEFGFTFPALAAALARHGARRTDGRPFSADQLHAAFRRAAAASRRRSTTLKRIASRSGTKPRVRRENVPSPAFLEAPRPERDLQRMQTPELGQSPTFLKPSPAPPLEKTPTPEELETTRRMLEKRDA
jgi:hypothetical protein